MIHTAVFGIYFQTGCPPFKADSSMGLYYKFQIVNMPYIFIKRADY